MAEDTSYENRLIRETSPYLLQHARNPVDWFPWSDEAFDKARRQDKPVFLSIGYSTCHWCHVMERESFENERIARILNEHFISIKVDREERPDIDAVYMGAVIQMTGNGGWPLSVFLTPGAEPFYGGTYFPPTDMYGRPGFDAVLRSIAEAWRNKREDVDSFANRMAGLISAADGKEGKHDINTDVVDETFSYLKSAFDSRYGGFGVQPKFPQPSNLTLLLDYWYRTRIRSALTMVEATLDAMADGGIYDQIGGGFHRYSTDEQWAVPHFEKMLYDQALITDAYIQAYRITENGRYERVIRETLDYVLRDMTSAEGGFFTAEDADSGGSEGTYYLWTPGEVEEVLGSGKAALFNSYYGVTESGNFEDRRTVLRVSASLDELAREAGLDPGEVERSLAEARSALLKERETRPRPFRDDKIITAWNGLMISAMASGGAVLSEERYTAAAEHAAAFVLDKLRGGGRLLRYCRDGKAAGEGFLDDYAFMIQGLVDLYEATFEERWLAEAVGLADSMIEIFADERSGGFFLSAGAVDSLPTRTKSSTDGAVPAGNSVAALALLRLGRLTMNVSYTAAASWAIESFAVELNGSPASMTSMLRAVEFARGPVREVVIAGRRDDRLTARMLGIVSSAFMPRTVVTLHEPGEAGKKIEELAPFTVNLRPEGGKTTAYICSDFSCSEPAMDIKSFNSRLFAEHAR